MNYRPSRESQKLHEDAIARWARCSTAYLKKAAAYFHKQNDGHSYICGLCCDELDRRRAAKGKR